MFQLLKEGWVRRSRVEQGKVLCCLYFQTFTKYSLLSKYRDHQNHMMNRIKLQDSVMIFAWSESVICLFAAPDDDPPEQKNNLLLHEAVKALFACSPLFHTQTLTLEAFPVPDVCCSTEQVADRPTTPPIHSDTSDDQETLSLQHPNRTNSRKRLTEMQPMRDRKRRKNSSWKCASYSWHHLFFLKILKLCFENCLKMFLCSDKGVLFVATMLQSI